MTQYYTTSQASQETKIPEGTIRSWMSRRPGVFEIGTDIIIEKSGRKMWTAAGLKTLLNQKETPGEETDTSSMDEILEPLLDIASKQLAHKYFEQLPIRTLRRIQMMMLHPSEEERILVQRAVDAAIAQGIIILTPDFVRFGDGD